MSTESADKQAERLEAVGEQLTSLLRQPAVSRRLRVMPGENDWSALQILAHIDEMIPYWMQHCQTLIAAAGERPRFGRPLDAPERLAGVERGGTATLEDLMAQLNEEVQTASREIRAMTPEERAKTGIHVRLGTMTVTDAVDRFIVSHAEEHLAQIRAALESE